MLILDASAAQAQSAAQSQSKTPAQSTTPAQPATQLDEVVVTALRRTTRASDTAVALTVVSGERLHREGIAQVGDLERVTPGLTTVQGGISSTRLVLRGVQGVGEPIVGLYYDETPMTGLPGTANDAGGATALLSLADVDRIEVLRGPQGALYGAGAMAGAVRVLWRKPEFNRSFEASATGMATDGSTGWRLEAIGNAALSDQLAARAVLWSEERPAYIYNAFLQRAVEGATVKGGRVAARARPNERLTVDGSIAWQSASGDNPWWSLGGPDFTARNQARLLNDDEQSLLALAAAWRGDGWEAVWSMSHARRSLDQVASDTSYQFATSLNNPAVCARLRGGGAPCTSAQQLAFDAYVRQLVPSIIYPQQDAVTDTTEARVSSLGNGSVRWTVGAFYALRDSALDNIGLRVDATTGDPVQPQSSTFRRVANDRLEQTAVYGETSWRILPRLDLTAGGRLFRYRRTAGGATTQGLDLINAAVTPYQEASATETGGALKFNAAWRLASGHLIYADASQGYRPGGANQVLNLPETLVAYAPDRLWTYQLGYKAAAFDRRLILDVSAYRMDWDNMQVAGSRPDGLFRFISNAGRARIDGLEATVEAHPFEGLTLNGAAALTDARLVEDQISGVVVAPGRAGDRIPYTPRSTLALGARYVRSGWAGLENEVELDARHVDESWSEFRPDNVFYRRLPAYTVASLRLAVRPGRGRWEAEARIDNLFDTVAIQAVAASTLTAGQTLVTAAPPRTASLRLRWRY